MDPSLQQRIRSAAVVLPVVVLLLWLGPWTSLLLLVLAALLAGRELAALLRRLGWTAPPFLPGAAVACLAASLAGWFGPALGPLIALAWLLPLLFLFRPRVPGAPNAGWKAWWIHLAAAADLGLLLSCLARLRHGPWTEAASASLGPRWIFYALLLIWANDTGAYAVGRLWGRRRLWPEVSPKKTWEGAAGGFLLTTAGALALRSALAPGLGPGAAALLGALAAVTAQLGDLIESRLKRVARVKDTGSILPGHGGVLDRLDSLLFAAPLFLYYLSTAAR